MNERGGLGLEGERSFCQKFLDENLRPGEAGGYASGVVDEYEYLHISKFYTHNRRCMAT